MAAISQKPVVFRELRHSIASRNQTHRNHAQSNRACHTYPTPRNIWLHIPELVWQLLSLLPPLVQSLWQRHSAFLIIVGEFLSTEWSEKTIARLLNAPYDQHKNEKTLLRMVP